MSTREYYEHYWSEAGYNPRRDDTPDYLRLLFQRCVHRDDDCLDLGCGDGGSSGFYLTAHSGSYVGVDVAQQALEVARERGFNVLRIDDAASLPFDDESFDVVVCSEVLEHLFEPQLAVAEAMRVLRPNGRLILTVPNVAYWRDRVDALLGVWQPGGDDRARAEPWRSPHIRFFRPATLRRMLLKAGFDHVDLIGLPFPLFGRVPLLRRFSRRPGVFGRAAARLSPSLFAYGIGAVAARNLPATHDRTRRLAAGTAPGPAPP